MRRTVQYVAMIPIAIWNERNPDACRDRGVFFNSLLDNRYLAGFSCFNFYLHSRNLSKAVPGEAAPVGTDIFPLQVIGADLFIVIFQGPLVRAGKRSLAFLDIYMLVELV